MRARGFFTLGRIAGLDDEAIEAAWKRGDRETIIQAAQKGR